MVPTFITIIMFANRILLPGIELNLKTTHSCEETCWPEITKTALSL